MSAIFLSASVPVMGRGNYYETADPFLIQFAVRELVTAVIKDLQIVWGGHPAITPMVWTICQDLNIDYSKSFILYQSRFFEEQFPQENMHFKNVTYIDAVPGDLEASLLRMREAMLSREDLKAAVFIGGMEGVEVEYEMFTRFHPEAKVLAVAAPGGAALQLAKRIGGLSESDLNNADFASLFRIWLSPQQNSGEKSQKLAEKILLVDDEEEIALIAQKLLEQLGYSVVSRTSSEEALTAFKDNPNGFDLIITDMTMPDMTGDKLAQEIIKIRPDIPIIITGSSEIIDLERAEEIGIKGNLLKPLVKSELSSIVRNVLGGATFLNKPET